MFKFSKVSEELLELIVAGPVKTTPPLKRMESYPERVIPPAFARVTWPENTEAALPSDRVTLSLKMTGPEATIPLYACSVL